MQDKPSYNGRGGLTQKMRCQLTSAACCAIKMHSKESYTTRAVKLLERDLQNGPYHCFGRHERCSSNFLLAKKRVESSGIYLVMGLPVMGILTTRMRVITLHVSFPILKLERISMNKYNVFSNHMKNQ